MTATMVVMHVDEAQERTLIGFAENSEQFSLVCAEHAARCNEMLQCGKEAPCIPWRYELHTVGMCGHSIAEMDSEDAVLPGTFVEPELERARRPRKGGSVDLLEETKKALGVTDAAPIAPLERDDYADYNDNCARDHRYA